MARSFKGYVPIEAPSFTLESPDGQRSLEVLCKPMVPGSVFLDFLSKTSGGVENPSALAGAVWDLFHASVRDDQWDVFRAFIDAPENGVSIDLLSEIGGYLSEVYSKRPTVPSPA